MVVNIVCYLAEQDAFRPENAVGLTDERRIEMREVITILRRRLQDQPEARAKVL
jgi:hypothetical protein